MKLLWSLTDFTVSSEEIFYVDHLVSEELQNNRDARICTDKQGSTFRMMNN